MCAKIVAVNHSNLADHLFSVTPVLMEKPEGLYYTAGYGDDLEPWGIRHESNYVRLPEPLEIPGNYLALCPDKYYDLPVMALTMPAEGSYIFRDILPEVACTAAGRNFYIMLNGVFHLTFVPAANAILKAKFAELRRELIKQNHRQGDCATWRELLRVAYGRVKLNRDTKDIEPIIDAGFVRTIGTKLSCVCTGHYMDASLSCIGHGDDVTSAMCSVARRVVEFDQEREEYHRGAPCSQPQ